MRSMLVLVLLLTIAGSSLASEGVLEINQTCGATTGCFAGDAPGFPVTISGPGSYRLTSNLILANDNTDGIVVNANDVGIDLNNFAILGPVTCSGSPLACYPNAGTGRGVAQTSMSYRGASVKNGTVSGMGTHGVQLGDQAEVRSLRVRWSRFVGINVGFGSTVSGNTVYQNGSGGVFANSGSTITGNTAYENGLAGILANAGSNVVDNTAYGNGTFGIFAGAGTTVAGNTAYNNLSHGITVGSGSTVQRNTMRLNAGLGLEIGSQSAYRENTITGNTTGTVAGSGVNMGDNSCNGATICP